MSPAQTDGTCPADPESQERGGAALNTFDVQYRRLVERIMTDGAEEANARTGHAVRALPGMTLEIEDTAADFPLLTLRKIPLRTFIAEQVWFLTGERVATDVLTQNTHIWDDFTNLNGVIGTAYGYRWRRHFHRDQIAELVTLLERDPSSRQGVVVAWDPGMDGLAGGVQRKNVPCPFAFTANIIGGRLHLHNLVRSNDVLLGLPHDVAGFCLLQHILAKRLGVLPGKYTHSISHAHIYDIHYDAAQALLQRVPEHPPIPLDVPADAYERALTGDVTLVPEIESLLAREYHPQAALQKLQIVL